ncbi:MAG: hypothetical protein ACXACR_13140, partial [Candidatus Hodarchaeales archaeon]
MFFSLFPPISIDGSINKSLNIPGLETLKSIMITSEKLSCTVEIDGTPQIFDVISFNDPVLDVNKRIDPDDDFPLELMPLATIELLETVAQFIGGYTLISSDPSDVGYLDVYRGDFYPISIRGAEKQLYALTAELRPLRKDYFVALNSLLEVDFESQLETSLATFIENVLKPMAATMSEVFNLDKNLNSDESVVNVIGSDFKRLVSRTEDLLSIVNYHMEQTAERHKAFLRLTLPLMLKQALLENFTDYIQFEKENSSIKLKISKR